MAIRLGTESLARASAKRPWLIVGIWGAVIAAAVLCVSTLLGGALVTTITTTDNPESIRAGNIVDERLGKTDNLNETIIVKSPTLTVDDPAFKQEVESLFSSVMALGKDVVVGGATYYLTGADAMVSADRRSTIISLTLPHDGDKRIAQIYQASDQFAQTGTFQIYHTGDASFANDTSKLAENTMKTGETVGIAVAIVVLAVVFGALAAALLPIALGLVAIVAALGLTALVGQVMDLTFTVTNIITMMGLAVGIDYSLFILTRFREERQKGLSKMDAIAATGATANKAVLFSGITVLLALAGLVVFPLTIFQTMGIGAILVVSTAILASLTLLPALLSLFGDKVNSIRIPFLQTGAVAASGDDASGFWAKTTRLVTRKPVVSAVLSVGLLLAAAVPYLDKQSGMSGISGIPDSLRAKQGFMVLVNDFHMGMQQPAMIVIDGNVNSQSSQNAIASLDAQIAADPSFTGVSFVPYPQKDLVMGYAGLAGDPMSVKAMEAVQRLRTDYIPTSFGSTDLQVLVGGGTAGQLDFNRTTDRYTPIIFIFVLALSFVVLTLAFRSIVISTTAILMNLLSVAASYGLIVLVFQKGVGAKLFGFQRVDVIETWLPLFLFALLFGLSMDYQVFLLSRIQEHYQKTKDNAASVSFGLRSTGRLITGAALIMVAVFGGFALGDMVMFQQMGFGLAAAVLIDATLVRSILVPATMKMLGDRNWYLPTWLSWIPRIGLGDGANRDEQARQPAPVFRPSPLLEPELIPIRVDNRDRQTVRYKSE